MGGTERGCRTPGVCLSDPEGHITVTVGWKRAGGLAALVLSFKDGAKNLEAKLKKSMKPSR